MIQGHQRNVFLVFFWRIQGFDILLIRNFSVNVKLLLFIIQTAIYILHQINDGLQIEYVLSLRDQIVHKKNGKANDRKLHMWNMRANNIGFIQWASFKFPLKI